VTPLAVRALSRRSREERGLTIVEVAVSLGVLAILLTGIFSSLTTANIAAFSAREAQAASEEALFRMDQYASQNVDQLKAGGIGLQGYFPVVYKVGSNPDGTPRTSALAPAVDVAMFNYVTTDPATPRNPLYVKVVPITADLVEIQVCVCWRSSDGTDRRLDLVSRVTR
jgi:type II secretory pathway pseudopilin PulG